MTAAAGRRTDSAAQYFPTSTNVSNCVAHFSKKLSNPVHNILGIRDIRFEVFQVPEHQPVHSAHLITLRHYNYAGTQSVEGGSQLYGEIGST